MLSFTAVLEFAAFALADSGMALEIEDGSAGSFLSL